MAEFRKIPVSDFECAPIRMISKDWLLFTASKPDGTFNPMTVSWGGIGELWGKNVAFIRARFVALRRLQLFAGSTTWLAMSTSSTPLKIRSSASESLAQVMPAAPAAICLCASAAHLWDL